MSSLSCASAAIASAWARPTLRGQRRYLAAVDRLRRRDRSAGGQYRTVLRGNAAALVNDLLFELLLIGTSILIRARIDDEQQVALLHEGVVLNGKLDQPAGDLGSDLNVVVDRTSGVVVARMVIGLIDDHQQHTAATTTPISTRRPVLW